VTRCRLRWSLGLVIGVAGPGSGRRWRDIGLGGRRLGVKMFGLGHQDRWERLSRTASMARGGGAWIARRSYGLVADRSARTPRHDFPRTRPWPGAGCAGRGRRWYVKGGQVLVGHLEVSGCAAPPVLQGLSFMSDLFSGASSASAQGRAIRVIIPFRWLGPFSASSADRRRDGGVVMAGRHRLGRWRSAANGRSATCARPPRSRHRSRPRPPQTTARAMRSGAGRRLFRRNDAGLCLMICACSGAALRCRVRVARVCCGSYALGLQAGAGPKSPRAAAASCGPATGQPTTRSARLSCGEGPACADTADSAGYPGLFPGHLG